jgi:hypothetical protein
MKAKLLKATLFIAGGLFCLAGPGLILPASWWKAMTGWVLDAATLDRLWTASPVFDYALRASMVAYLWIGVVLLVAATDPVKHRVQIDIAIGGLFLMAVVTFIAGYANGIPPMWFLGDVIPSLIGAGLLLAFRPGKA